MNILITGGAGYIGSHTCLELITAGHTPIIYDNFSNCSPSIIERLEKIAMQKITVIEGDVRDEAKIVETLTQYHCESVIHFAGLKAVGESVQKPTLYYDNNVTGTLCLLRAMQSANVKSILFSSSATVYGTPHYLPLNESHPLSATNPYGRTKLMIEEILRDLFVSDPTWCIAILRYFNPVGAHKSGLIGENPIGIPNNLMPYLSQVATGRYPFLNIWGNDYDTRDGTGVRDYIHVVDLARGHLKALSLLNHSQCMTLNLGTGVGYSVLDVVKTFERVTGLVIPYQIKDRRPGDIAACYADPRMAEKQIGWKAAHTLDEMCIDTWRWLSSGLFK